MNVSCCHILRVTHIVSIYEYIKVKKKEKGSVGNFLNFITVTTVDY